MADNIQLNVGSGGDIFAADDISSVKYPRTKLTIGADGVNDGDVSSANPLPVESYATLPDTTFAAVRGDGLAFQTATLLGLNDTYDTGIISLVGYTQVQTHILSNAVGTMTVDFCRDAGGTDILRTLTIPYGTADLGTFQTFSAPAFTPYARYRFQATAAGQTDFYFDTKLLTKSLSGQLLGVNAFVSPLMVSTLTRSVIAGKTKGGVYENVEVDNGAIETHISEPSSAFGEVSTVQPLPTAQVDFVYGINTNVTVSSITGSGTVTAANALLSVDTTAAASSSAQLASRRYLNYRPGQGAMARFTAMFTTGVADSKQYAGPGTSSMNNGFFFGYNGTSFGIAHINNGSEVWIPRESWNIDVCDGSGSSSNKSGINLDPTKLNVFQVKYQYLGAGNIFFYVESSSTGEFTIVHVIRFAGTNTTTSVSQPNMQMIWQAVNTTNATSIKVQAASCGLFVEGIRRMLGPKYARDFTKTSITTETNILSLRNATTYNGVSNRSQMHLRSVSIAANKSGSIVGTAILRIIRNATLGGSPVYAANDGTTADNGVTITSGQSIASYDTTGTTITGGTVVFNSAIVVGGNSHFDLTDQDIFLGPSDVVTFSFQSNDSCTCTVAASWSEDL